MWPMLLDRRPISVLVLPCTLACDASSVLLDSLFPKCLLVLIRSQLDLTDSDIRSSARRYMQHIGTAFSLGAHRCDS